MQTTGGHAMSKGIGARAHKISENDTEVTYEYGGYNLNKPGFENPSPLYDGRIRILKSCFLSQMIYANAQRKANNRKKQQSNTPPFRLPTGQ
jgi:hypothetical protein